MKIGPLYPSNSIIQIIVLTKLTDAQNNVGNIGTVIWIQNSRKDLGPKIKTYYFWTV